MRRARFARKLGTVMPFWYGLNLLLLLGETVTLRQLPGMSFLAAADAIWVPVIELTLILMVPKYLGIKNGHYRFEQLAIAIGGNYTFGIYGLMAYLTGQGSREVGIRLALGATRANIATLAAE